MRIAIIEDRIGRMEQFSDFDLHNCEIVSIITGANFDKLNLSLDAKNTAILDQYDCIASHRSALKNEIRDLIKEYCKKTKKPLIFFSGGISSSVFKDIDFPFLHINSKDFYSKNLKLFINNCINTKSINLLMLQFGERWKLSLLLNLRNNIAVSQNKQLMKTENPELEFEDKELIKRIRDLEINTLIKHDLITKRTEEIFNRNDYSTISPDQVQEIKSVINHLINGIV